MTKNNNGLVEFCKTALANKTGYVYGTLGQLCTESLLDYCASRYPSDNLAGGQMRKIGERWKGRRVVDCIGLLKYYLMADRYGEDPKYNAEYDKSANGAYNMASTKGSISTMPDLPGIGLHMPGHFGVYIGNGYAIEARGTAYGVVLTEVKKRPWNAWFKIPWIEYIPADYCDTPYPFNFPVGTEYQFLTGSDIWPGTGGIWRQISRVVAPNGYILTKFRAISPGSTGFYMKVNGVPKRVVIGTVTEK